MLESAIKKIKESFWGENDTSDDYVDDGYDIEDADDGYDEETYNRPSFNVFKSNKNKVVAMPQPQQIKMKISKPTNFDQVDEIIFQLKNKNAVVINLEYVSKDVARRIVDTVGGAVTALDGHMEKVSNSIFVIAPFNYDIVNEITKDKIEGKFAASLFTK
ncbi:MAG: cell division protein SepF [Clostridia bacterium]|nr:cell division protein SepF [Clostridia bacterium]